MDIKNSLAAILTESFTPHPFLNQVTESNAVTVLGNYLAMSLAFPYLQAGSQLRLLFHYIENNQDIPRDAEITAVVGAFLTWDETGGHSVILREGNRGLPKILDTNQFHANLLRNDIRTILGKDISPAFSPTTKEYLQKVYYGLSNLDYIDRVANMVAFESHAATMIDSLWKSLIGSYNVQKEKLVYFNTHVGADDPAEEYHKDMTARMISELIKTREEGRFLASFKDAYDLNFNWCGAITKLS